MILQPHQPHIFIIKRREEEGRPGDCVLQTAENSEGEALHPEPKVEGTPLGEPFSKNDSRFSGDDPRLLKKQRQARPRWQKMRWHLEEQRAAPSEKCTAMTARERAVPLQPRMAECFASTCLWSPAASHPFSLALTYLGPAHSREATQQVAEFPSDYSMET